MSSRKTHYCLEWENPSKFPDFAEWVKRIPNDPFSANCSICRGKPFQLSNLGKRSLKSHAEGKKHQDALRLRRTVGPLFTPAVPEGEPSTETPHQPAVSLPIMSGSKLVNVDLRNSSSNSTLKIDASVCIGSAAIAALEKLKTADEPKKLGFYADVKSFILQVSEKLIEKFQLNFKYT